MYPPQIPLKLQLALKINTSVKEHSPVKPSLKTIQIIVLEIAMKIVMESAYAVLKIYSGMERNVLNAICLPTMILAS